MPLKTKTIFTRLSFSCALLATAMGFASAQTEEDIKTWKQQAKDGDKNALYHLGKANEAGTVEKQSFKKAFEYYEQASLLDFDSAQIRLAELYETGRGTDQNFRMAFTLYKLAAKKGNPEAVYRLAKCYENGLGTPIDEDEAARLYMAAKGTGHSAASSKMEMFPVDSMANPGDMNFIKAKADRGEPEYQFQMGLMHETGDKVEQDWAKARLWYYKASKTGYSLADFKLGQIYAQGKGTAVNERLAAKYLLDAASKGIHAADEELNKFDLEKLLGKDNFDLVKRNARIGVPADLYKMSVKYLNGEDVAKNFDSAFYYCQKAAMAGNEPAMLTMGKWYEQGTGVKQNYEQAFQWYSGAVAVKNDSAYFLVAEYYEKGTGVEKNIAKAARYYVKSSIKGKAEAAARLKKIDKLDQYFSPNDVEYIYYKALQGDQSSQTVLAKYLALGKDNQQTVYWMEKAAGHDLEMQYKLAEVYQKGLYGTPINLAKALGLYEKSAATGKYPEALLAAGMMYAGREGYAGEDYFSKALAFLDKYKNSGIKIDYFKLNRINALQGKIYYQKQDFPKAIACYSNIIKNFKPEWRDKKTEPSQEMLDDLSLFFDAIQDRAMCYLFLKKMEAVKTDSELGVQYLTDFKQEAAHLRRNDELNGKFYFFEAKVAASKGDSRTACLLYTQAKQLAGISDEQLEKTCSAGN